ncbi:MAG: hypothetical protein KC496_00780 [Anaerolineae bacterium]|nr:hypothetical protein [Anaerolineae bacterium]
MISPLTIFYTDNLRGDLARLPRLHSFLQQQRQRFEHQPLLIDLGNSCAPDVWHCRATEGRSTLIVLDAMGYHAANVVGVVDESRRDDLRSSLGLGLLDERRSWRYAIPPVQDADLVVAVVPVPALKLCVVAAPAAETSLKNRVLKLQSPADGSIGMVQVDVSAQVILHTEMLALPSGLKADPTISATVDFVEDEARFYQKKRGQE